MSRRLLKHEQTWIDKATLEVIRPWPASKQEELFKELGGLFKALKSCSDPVQDPILARFRPVPYHDVIGLGDIFEYRLKGPTRVIALVKPTWVLMLTITLSHNHNLMKMLLKVHQGTIAAFAPPEE